MPRTRTPRKFTSVILPRMHMAPTSPIDWEGALWDTIGHLQTLIRIDTVNPPGNEMAAARYLDDVLRGAGIESMVLEPTRGRAAVVARLRGDGRRRPILLLAHMDVVGVDKDKWTQNPFGGELVDGYLYGRGAIDDKGMLAVNLQTMLLLQAQVAAGAVALSRDVIFVATSDEEAGGDYGIDWLLTKHPELMGAEFALNEGGRIRMRDGQPLYCAVQCAEKVPHVVSVQATGFSGHASIPIRGNAISRLARAVARIADHVEPLTLTDVTRRFFSTLATLWPDADVGRAMADVASDDNERQTAGAAVLQRVPSFDAVLRNGVSPVMISGGTRSNVIPGDARATLNVRTLPGVSIDDVVQRLGAAAAEDGVELSVASRGVDAPPSTVSSTMFAAIMNAVAEQSPGLPVVPYLSTGATDSAALRGTGVQAYGLLPFPLTEDDEARMHGHDERLAVTSLGYGVRLVFGIVRRMAV